MTGRYEEVQTEKFDHDGTYGIVDGLILGSKIIREIVEFGPILSIK